MKATLDFVINAEIDIPDEKVDITVKDAELTEEIKNDIKKDFKNWYGVKVTNVDLVIKRNQ